MQSEHVPSSWSRCLEKPKPHLVNSDSNSFNRRLDAGLPIFSIALTTCSSMTHTVKTRACHLADGQPEVHLQNLLLQQHAYHHPMTGKAACWCPAVSQTVTREFAQNQAQEGQANSRQPEAKQLATLTCSAGLNSPVRTHSSAMQSNMA